MIQLPRWEKGAKRRWWFGEEVPADPLGDLVTQANRLSVWVVEQNRSNMDELIAALAAKRTRLDAFEFALLNQGVLAKLKIDYEHSTGRSASKKANENWHRDLIALRAESVVRLAGAMMASAEKLSLLPRELLQCLRRAVVQKELGTADLTEEMRLELISKYGPLEG